MTDITEQRKFDIKPHVDPATLTAIRIREQACDDPALSDGAVRLFTRLLDLSLNPGLNQNKKGFVIASQLFLSCKINCSDRELRRRIEELVAGNYLWTKLVPRQNTKMILSYHITAFFPKHQASEDMPNDGMWGNGKRRFDSGFSRTGHGATGRGRRVAKGFVDQFGKPIFADFGPNAAVTGQREPVTPDSPVRSQRTEPSFAIGPARPVTEDGGVRSHRPAPSGDTGQRRPVTEGVAVLHKESQIESETTIQSSKSSSKSLKPAVERENAFLGEIVRLAIEHDGEKSALWQSEKFGRQWRARLREDWDRMERILADARAAAREGTITGSVGTFFNHFWSEFSTRKASERSASLDR